MWQDIRGDKIIVYEFRNKGYNVGAKVKQANRRHITAEGHKKTIKCWRIRGLLSFHDIIRVVPTTFLLYFFYIVASSFFLYTIEFFYVFRGLTLYIYANCKLRSVSHFFWSFINIILNYLRVIRIDENRQLLQIEISSPSREVVPCRIESLG